MQRLGGIADWLGAIVLGVLLILGVGSLVGGQTQTILSVVNPPIWNTPDRPITLLFDPLAGSWSMERSVSISDGLYGFWWTATAGEADCTFRLVLEGPDGPKVLDDFGRIDAGQSAAGMTPRLASPPGTSSSSPTPTALARLGSGRGATTTSVPAAGRPGADDTVRC